MKTKMAIKTSWSLPNNTVIVSGSIEGRLLTLEDKGTKGSITTADGVSRYILVGVGVIDPNYNSIERQGILIEKIEEMETIKSGMILEFDCS